MSAGAQSPAGAFREQDTIAMFHTRPDSDSHPEWRWKCRCPQGWEDYNVRAAWREAEPRNWPGSDYARYHKPTGMLLIAEYGFLNTVVQVGEPADGDDPNNVLAAYKEGL